MFRYLIAALGILLLAPAPDAQAKDDLWVHIAVDSEDEDGERVRINVPISLVEAVLPLIEEEEFQHGRVRIDGEDLDREDIIALLKAVESAEDGEYVTVEDDGERVRVAKDGKHLIVNVEERHGRHQENVDIRVPVAVLSALVSGGDDELDVLAAVKALGDHADGNLLTVNDDDGTTVRIWVDKKNASD